MATRTPVVATNVGGLPEGREHDRTGLLVPPRDPAALAAAISSLLADPERGRRLAATAAERMHGFTIETVAESLHRSLRAARERRRPGAGVPGGSSDVNPALVLCYHAVSPTWESALSVAPDALERQIEHLLRRGWRATTFTEAIVGARDRRAFAVTFDDAFATVRTYAAPVLRQFGVPARCSCPPRSSRATGSSRGRGSRAGTTPPRRESSAP